MKIHNHSGKGHPFKPNQQQPSAVKMADAPAVYPMPQDVTAALKNQPCGNFSLQFYRFVPKPEKDKKGAAWKAVLEAGNKLYNNEDAREFLKRQALLGASMRQIYGNNNVIEFQGVTKSRLSIGFGNTGPLDTGLTLQRLYCLPYLPAAAIKGVCRARALDEIARSLGAPALSPEEKQRLNEKKRKTPLEHLENWLVSKEKNRKQAWENFLQRMQEYNPDMGAEQPEKEAIDFLNVFGSQDTRGKVIFYDAFPVEITRCLFDLDIINPHYQPYYESKGKKPPADYYSPVPINFLTVAPGVQFQFVITGKNDANDSLQKAQVWLQNALSENGIGAKTALGYGEIK